MEIDEFKENDEFAQTAEGAERIIFRKKQEQLAAKFRQVQRSLTRKASLFAAAVIIGIYFLLPVSKVQDIVISGNHYLSSAYIKELSGLTMESRFYLSVPFLLAKRIEADPLIEEVAVTWQTEGVIAIEVNEEKIIGYRYDGDQPEILTAGGTSGELKSDYLDILAQVPLISGFDDAQLTAKLCAAFADVDRDVIEQMSEVSQYALSYDENMIKILMRTGGYFIAGFYNLAAINYYNDYYSRSTHKEWCIYAAEKGSSSSAEAYTSVCPWDDASAAVMTEDGYYLDEDGNIALDEEGRPIAVSLDEEGNELVDENFLENYRNGYYASGQLVLPEENEG